MTPPPAPFIAAEELSALVNAGSAPSLLDVRWRLEGPAGPGAFRSGHLPGAVYVDLESELSGPVGPGTGRHPLPAADTLRAAVRSWGLRTGRPVVVYDDWNGFAAARAWWVLRWAGLPDVRILDGGLAAWRARNGPIETGESSPPPPGDVTVVLGSLPVLDADGAAALVAAGGVLLDARPGERFEGAASPYDPRPGHVPGAVSAPAVDAVGVDGRLRPPAELLARFTALGLASPEGADRAVPAGAYCGSGVTAAYLAATVVAAGLPLPALYVGSWSQWAADPDRPVESGPSPDAPSR